MTEEIKPCPFCGCKNVSVIQGSTFRWVVAVCDSCQAQSSEVRIQHNDVGELKTRMDALNEWNTRASINHLKEQ